MDWDDGDGRRGRGIDHKEMMKEEILEKKRGMEYSKGMAITMEWIGRRRGKGMRNKEGRDRTGER